MSKITTNVSTDALDANTDKLNQARPQIKATIDATNAVLDKFAISNPSNGEGLVTDTAGQFANTAYTVPQSERVLSLVFGSLGSTSGTNPKTATANLDTFYTSDPSGLLTGTSVPAGTYFLEIHGDDTSTTTTGRIQEEILIGTEVVGTVRYRRFPDDGPIGESSAVAVAREQLNNRLVTISTAGDITIKVTMTNNVVGIADAPVRLNGLTYVLSKIA